MEHQVRFGRVDAAPLEHRQCGRGGRRPHRSALRVGIWRAVEAVRQRARHAVEELPADVARLALTLPARVPRAVPRALGRRGEAHARQMVDARADGALEQLTAASRAAEALVVVPQRDAPRLPQLLLRGWRREALWGRGRALARITGPFLPSRFNCRSPLQLERLHRLGSHKAACRDTLGVGEVGGHSRVHVGFRCLAAPTAESISHPHRDRTYRHVHTASQLRLR